MSSKRENEGLNGEEAGAKKSKVDHDAAFGKDSSDSDDSDDSDSSQEFKAREEEKEQVVKDVEPETELAKEIKLYEEGQEKRKEQELTKLKHQRGTRQRDSESDSRDSESESESSEEESDDDDSDKDDDYEEGSKSKKKLPAKPKKKVVTKQRKKSEYDSEDESSDEENREPTEEPIDLADINRMQLTRKVLLQWVDEPYFDECEDGYARVKIGTVRDVDTYRMCKIISCSRRDEVYKVDGQNVDCVFLLELGKARREWKLDSFSNSPFLESEYQFWLKEMAKASKTIPGKSVVAKFENKVRTNVLEYQYTPEDISEKIERKRAKRKVPVNIVTEKIALERDILIAKQNNDHEQASKLEVRLEELNAEQKRRADLITQRFKHNQNVNQRNAQINRNAKGHRGPKISASGEKVWNPFARMPTRPNNLWSTKLDGEGADGQPEDLTQPSTDTEPHAVDKSGQSDQSERNALGLPSSTTRVKSAPGARSIHEQVEISLDDAPSSATQSAKKKKKKKKSTGPEKGVLSLEEYIKRRQMQD